MAVEPVSSISPVAAAPNPPGTAARAQATRPPETTPDARETARQENDARRSAQATSGASPAYLAGPQDTSATAAVGTRENVVAVPNDAEGSLQRASSQIARAYSGGEPTPADMRAASEAYRAEAAARDDLARQQQGNGTRTTDVLA